MNRSLLSHKIYRRDDVYSFKNRADNHKPNEMPLTAKSARFSTIFPQIHIRNLSSNCIQNSAVYSVNIIHISKYLCAYSLRFEKKLRSLFELQIVKKANTVLVIPRMLKSMPQLEPCPFIPVLFKSSLNLCDRQHYYTNKYFPDSAVSLTTIPF